MKPAKPFSSFICTAIVFISLPTLAFAGDWGNSGSSCGNSGSSWGNSGSSCGNSGSSWGNSGSSWGNSNQNNNPQNTTEEKTTITLTPNTSGVHFEASAGVVIPFVPYAKVYQLSNTKLTPVSYRSIAAAGMINLGVRLKYVNFLIEQHFGKTYYIGDKYDSFFNRDDNYGEKSGSYFATYLTVGGIIPTSPNFDLRISAGFGAIYGSTATLPDSSKAVFSFKTGIGGDYIWDNGIKFGFDISYAMAYFTKTAAQKGQKLLNYIVPALHIGYIY